MMLRLADSRPAKCGRACSSGETMAEDLDREELIALLERLGHADDSDALAAARKIHMRVTTAGESWDELLLPLEADQDSELDALKAELDAAEDTAQKQESELEALREQVVSIKAENEADQYSEPDTSPEQPDTAIDKTTAVDDAQSLSLIDKILAKRDVADATREELLAYKDDIAHGEFDLADRKYLQALEARISKRR